ncbi:hypothetical protein N431DRAFT_400970 [Stipitochalara longipes BDJ]|nr:hypothetical protein N431DRAFT_400970 [Stipitochalara longipes BDJ]
MGSAQVSCGDFEFWCNGVRADYCGRVCGVCSRRKDKGVSCVYSNDNEATPGALVWNQGKSRFELPKPPSTLLRQVSRQDRQANGQSSSLSPNTSEETRVHGANQNFGNILGRENPGEENLRALHDSESTGRNTTIHGSAELGDASKGIDSMTGVIGEQSHGHGFFGSSSAGSFMTQIKSAIDAKVGLASRRPSISGTAKASLFTTSPTTQAGETRNTGIEYVLPPRKTADNLVGVYWELVYPLYPFLDRPLFEDAYQSVWSGSESTTDERIFMCTLNVVFALACQLSESVRPEKREDSAKVYFKRAQELLQLDFWDTGSTELIQCLLLMGQYLQSTSTPHQCWMVVGHAVRMAQGLGFHLPESSFELQSGHERQFSRVIWHGCVLMDRVLSMTFGRPAMISKSLANAVPLPAIIEPENFSYQTNLTSLQAGTPTSMMAFFVHSLQLYSIINDILLQLYMADDQGKQKDPHGPAPEQSYQSFDMAAILKLDNDLMMWGRSLPPHLRVSCTQSSENRILWRQAVVCRARYLHARILLFRPVLSRFCLLEPTSVNSGTVLDESLTQRMVLQCSTLCLTAAHQMIELIHSNLASDRMTGPLPAWWYCVLYIYTAATVILAAHLRPVIETDISEYSTTKSWDHAIELLKSFGRMGQSAQRCVAALEILSTKISRKVSVDTTDQLQHSQRQTAPFDPVLSGPDTDLNLDEFSGFDFSGVELDLSDMSWLNSMPGNL